MAALVTMPTTTGMTTSAAAVQQQSSTTDNNNGSSSSVAVVEESQTHIRDDEMGMMQDEAGSLGSGHGHGHPGGSPSAPALPGTGPENNNPTSSSPPSVLVTKNTTRQRRVVHRRRRQRHLAMSPPTDDDDDDEDDDMDDDMDEEEEDEDPEAADDLRPSGRQQQVGKAGGLPVGVQQQQQQAEQLYSLRWHDFQSSILSSFRHLRDVEDFVDVTLACDGKSFTAHKMVLSACSPYFRHLLKANPCQHPIVILRDVKYRDMEALLRFMYNGEVSVSNEQLPSVLHTARTLQVKGLADVPENNNSSSNNNNSTGLNHNSKRVLDYSPNQTPSSRDSSTERPATMAAAISNSIVHPPSRKRARSGSKSPIALAQHPEEMMGLLKESRRRRSSNDDEEDEEEDEEDEDEEVLKERMRLLDAHRESLLSQALEGRSSQSLMAHLLATRRQSGNQSEASSVTGHQGRTNLHHAQRRSSSHHQDDEASDTDDTDASDRDRTDVGDLSNTEDNVYPSSGLMGDLHHHQRSGSHSLHGEMQPPSGGGYGGSSAQHHPLLNLQGLQSLFPGGGNSNGPSGGRDGSGGGHLHNSGSSSDLAQATRRSLDLMRIRATDPRPCPQCGKIYRSAHTLRTHLEDKHTVCPGYRCVLCGTVAKSRNSLHSHMSRQHRGISTKDLPVVPMPAPFDPVLASCLLAKAGVKVSPAELAARASPTSGNPRGRTADLRLDFKSPHSSGGGSLPPGTLPPQIMYNINQKVTIGGLQSHRNNPLQLIPLDQDAEDLSLAQQRLRSEARDHQQHHGGSGHHREHHREHSGSRAEKGSSGGGVGSGAGMAASISPYGPAAAGLVNRLGLSGKMGKQWLETNMAALQQQQQQQQQGSSPGSNASGAAGTGSALLDTYLQLIAEHSSNMAAMAAAAAAQQQQGQQPNANDDSPGMMDSPKAGLTGAD